MNRSRQRILTHGKDKKQEQANLITKAIIVILLMFLITEIPMAVTVILWILSQRGVLRNITLACNDMLDRFLPLALLVNSSYNIFCYMLLSTQYNETLKLLFTDYKFHRIRPSRRDLAVEQQDTQL